MELKFDFLRNLFKPKDDNDFDPDRVPDSDPISESKNVPQYEELCLLADSNSNVVGRGIITSPPNSFNIQITLTSDITPALASAEELQTIPLDDDISPCLGRVLKRQGKRLILDPLRDLGTEVRRDLRLAINFDSFIYPQSGGRIDILSNDISCGGVAFTCGPTLAARDKFEIVIPIVEEGPLVLPGEVLRVIERGNRPPLYACHFLNLCPDEEAKLREAIYQVQLDTHAMAASRN